MRPLLVLAFFCLVAFSPVRAGITCDGSLNTSPKGLNPACPSASPYCIGGTCAICNPYYLDDYVCDCPAGKGCCRDQRNSQCLLGTCVTMPKYGSSCTKSNPDCTTTYANYPQYTVQLVCVSGFCRYCDPVVNGTGNDTMCPVGVSQGGQVRNCISPGIWGVPGPSR